MKKNLLLTFDYELFLGKRSGTVHDCLIQPTYELTSILNKHGVKSIFFVDTTYLLTLEKYAAGYKACKNDLEIVSEQLRELNRDGHDVFPHIHPHWLNAVYSPQINQWQLNDTTLYRFHQLSPSQREEIFTGSLNLLQKILGKSNRPIDGYRAGGWCVQPISDFIPHFRKYGIKYEFSVLPGYYQFTNAQYFDFTAAPHKDYYHFENDVTIEDKNGSFMEFTGSMITMTKPIRLIDKFTTKLRYKLLNDHTFHKGSGQSPVELINEKPISTDAVKLGDPPTERVAIELLSSIKLNHYLRYLEKKDYMMFISHPKMITHHSMKIFDKFLHIVNQKYSLITDFRNIARPL